MDRDVVRSAALHTGLRKRWSGVWIHFWRSDQVDRPLDRQRGRLYLLDAVKRHGIGRALVVRFMTLLACRGFTSCGLWTLSSNLVARRFYEAMGGRAGETRIDRRNNLDYEDIAYLWDDVSRVRGT